MSKQGASFQNLARMTWRGHRRVSRRDSWDGYVTAGVDTHRLTFAESSSVVYMTITSRLFEAYLKCPTKCFLWSRGETGTSNSYADWAQVLNISYRSEGISR